MLMHQKSNPDRIRGVHAYSWRADKHAEGRSEIVALNVGVEEDAA